MRHLRYALVFVLSCLMVACTDEISRDSRITNDVAVADIDADGFLDLVLARRHRKLNVDEENDRSDVSMVVQDERRPGKFVRIQTRRAGRNPRQVEVLDLDLDGELEIITVNRSPSDLSIFYADTRFAPGFFLGDVRIEVGVRPTAFAIADIDADGYPDVSCANSEEAFASVLLQDAAMPGSFRPEIRIALGMTQATIAAADVDLDGNLDLVVAGEPHAYLIPQAATGGGVFESPQLILTGGRFSTVAIGDLDRDGVPDLVLGDRLGERGRLHVLLQDRVNPRSFRTPIVMPTVEKPVRVAIGDLDGDGAADLALASFQERSRNKDEGWVSTFLQNAAAPGSFSENATYRMNGQTNSVRIVDLDGDGRVDLVVSSTGARVLYATPGAPGFFERQKLLRH